MSTITLVLSGVLQSWGTTTIGHSRATNSYPTKSAVVGLIANALGRDRSDSIDDIAAVDFGIRIDVPGVVQRDYHTVSILKQPTKGDRINRVTERFYLSDAVFVVVISHPDEALIMQIADALQKPARPIFLGRKSCPPTRPVFYSLSNKDFVSVLQDTEWQADMSAQRAYLDSEVTLDVFRDPVNADEGFDADVISDHPLSFDPDARRYASRGVYRTKVTIALENQPSEVPSANAIHLAMNAAGVS